MRHNTVNNSTKMVSLMNTIASFLRFCVAVVVLRAFPCFLCTRLSDSTSAYAELARAERVHQLDNCSSGFIFSDVTADSASTPEPNIVLIFCDDLGYSDVGFNGATDIKTPHLDRLASNGIIFSSAYVAHPFCGPSRMGLMSGRYPPHTNSAHHTTCQTVG